MGIEIRGLREDEFGVHDELIYESYKEYDREGHEDRWWSHIATHDPYYEPEQTRVMLVDGEMVASVSNYLREMYCAGRHAKISAIGSVATHPNHRRKGYVRQVLAESRQWMLDSGFDFSFLFGDQDVYGSSGWEMFSAFNAMVKARVPKEDLGLTVRQAQFPDDVATLASVYASFNEPLTGPFVRSEAYWETRASVGYFRDNRTTFYLVEEDGVAVGYYRSDKPGWVSEMAWRHDDGELASRIVGTALAQWPEAEETAFGFYHSELARALDPFIWAPTASEYHDRRGILRLEESYKGLWSYIGPGAGLFPEITDNASLLRFLHANEYVFYSGVDNF